MPMQKQEPRKHHYAKALCKSRHQCLQGRRIVEGICLLHRKHGRKRSDTEEEKGAEENEDGIVKRLTKNGLIDKDKVGDIITKKSSKNKKKNKGSSSTSYSDSPSDSNSDSDSSSESSSSSIDDKKKKAKKKMKKPSDGKPFSVQ